MQDEKSCTQFSPKNMKGDTMATAKKSKKITTIPPKKEDSKKELFIVPGFGWIEATDYEAAKKLAYGEMGIK